MKLDAGSIRLLAVLSLLQRTGGVAIFLISLLRLLLPLPIPLDISKLLRRIGELLSGLVSRMMDRIALGLVEGQVQVEKAYGNRVMELKGWMEGVGE